MSAALHLRQRLFECIGHDFVERLSARRSDARVRAVQLDITELRKHMLQLVPRDVRKGLNRARAGEPSFPAPARLA